MTEQTEKTVPLSVVRDLVDALLSFTGRDDLIPVVDLEGVGWAIPSGACRNSYWVHDKPDWVGREDAAHDIACILSNPDGKNVSVISVSLEDEGCVSGQCLGGKEDYRRFFGPGLWE